MDPELQLVLTLYIGMKGVKVTLNCLLMLILVFEYHRCYLHSHFLCNWATKSLMGVIFTLQLVGPVFSIYCYSWKGREVETVGGGIQLFLSFCLEAFVMNWELRQVWTLDSREPLGNRHEILEKSRLKDKPSLNFQNKM